MRNKYNGDDLKARLGGTVLRYKNVPYMCEVEGQNLSLYNLENGTLQARIEPDDPFLDISSLTLGFMNLEHPDYKMAVYLKREPFRQYRQGVDLSRLTQTILRNGLSGPIHWKYLQCKGLLDCVLERYPSFSEAVEKITKKGFYSVALSKNVAVKREGELLKVFVKTDEVGYIRMGDKKVILPKTDQSGIHAFFLSQVYGWIVTEGNK